MKNLTTTVITVLLACAAQARGVEILASSKPAVDKDDLAFVESAAQAGMFEVRSSELAIKRGVGSAEQAFARQMIEDHTKANAQLSALAGRKGIALASDLDKKHQAMLDALGTASDKEFTKDYVAAQLKGHQQAVSLFSEESKVGKDADLRSFAGETLPTLEAHLEHVKKVADRD
jgi:putative membrane protein